jgi:hypothetical protein
MFNFKDKSTADFNSQLPPAINNTNPPNTSKKFCILQFSANIVEQFEFPVAIKGFDNSKKTEGTKSLGYRKN